MRQSCRVCGGQLAEVYSSLLGQARESAGEGCSYNLVLADDYMCLVPRSAEACGAVSLNALGFAGTALVKSQLELEFIKNQGVATVLTAVAYKW